MCENQKRPYNDKGSDQRITTKRVKMDDERDLTFNGYGEIESLNEKHDEFHLHKKLKEPKGITHLRTKQFI